MRRNSSRHLGFAAGLVALAASFPLCGADSSSPELTSSNKEIVTYSSAAMAAENSGVVWHSWSDALFQQAKKEKKFVLLDLEAVWCHWCHVMDRETYRDPEVVKLLNSRYICVKVDQDSRPDLSHKYEDYGWPATIVFAPDGTEIVKRSGYIRPEKMSRLLKAIIADPSPEEKNSGQIGYSEKTSLGKDLKAELLKKHVGGYDSKYGAWGRFHKFLDWDSVELSMELGLSGDKGAEQRARQTLTAQLNLLDPVWGGIYQYSTDGDWKHPHFEKIMQMQAENLKVYSLGTVLYGDVSYKQAANKIADYLDKFLSAPDGAFYTSQDADLVKGQHSGEFFELGDAARRKKGIPRIDKHSYARENGWAIEGLTHLYMATGDKTRLARALKATNWVLANRALPSGGFSHDAKDPAGPYLGDSLAMGRAFLALYEATAEKIWLQRARSAADFIGSNFNNYADPKSKTKTIGFLTASANSSKVAKPEPLLDENVRAARFLNLLSHYTGQAKYKKMAEQAMRFLAVPQVARKRSVLVAGILLADRELSRAPAHITVVGGKKDPVAASLFKAALASPSVYRRIEWYDRSEGNLANMDIEYPDLKKAAVFSCGDGTCSTPVYEPKEVSRIVKRASM